MEKEVVELYKKIFDQATDGILLADIKTKKFIFGNRMMRQMLGVSGSELLKMGVQNIHPKKEVPRALSDFERLAKGKGNLSRDVPVQKKDGTIFFVDIKTSLVDFNNGRYLMGIFRDVTERKRAEDAVRINERLYLTLLESAAHAGIGVVIVQDRDGKKAAIFGANDRALKMSGYTQAEAIKLTLPDVIPPKEIKAMISNYYARQAGKKAPLRYETTLIRKDKTLIPIAVSPSVITLNGKPATVAFLEDISEKKNAEEALKQSESKYRNIFTNSPLGIATLDREMRFLTVNDTFCKIVGVPEKEILKLHVSDITPPDYVAKDIKAAKDLLAGKINQYKSEEHLIRRDGKTIWLSFTVTVIRNAKGEFQYYLTMFDDITQIKIAEKSLKEREDLYRRLVELSHEGVFIHQGGKMVYANPAMVKLLGAKSQDQIVGRKVLDFVDPSDRSWVKERIERLYKHLPVPIFINEKLRRVDGTPFDTEVVSSGVLFKDKPSAQGMVRDVTQRIRYEEKLSEDYAREKAIFEGMQEGLFVVDMNAKVLMANKMAQRLLGWKQNGILGKEYYNFNLYDQFDKIVPVKKRPLMLTLKTGKVVDTNDYSVVTDGEKIDISVITQPILVEGKMIGALAVFRDIRHEKEVERAKSEFVSVASHQLRTPLGISKWYLEAMKTDDLIHKNPDTAANYLNVIDEDNERLISLINDLLSVSRIEQYRVPDNPEVIEVGQFMKETVEHLNAIADKRKIKLVFINQLPGPVKIKIDKERFKQVLECLISNSVKYSDPGEKVIAKLKKTDGSIKFSVSDTGIGITKGDRSKVFTKFFRSNEAVRKDSEGTGLGLFVTKNYIEGWGGTIDYNSVPEKFTVFFFSLPLKKLKP